MVAAAGVAASVAGTVASAASSSGSVSGAASAANGISQQAINQAQGYKDSDQALASPFIGTGTSASNQLAGLMGLNGQGAADSVMQAFQASPSYGYQLDQGLRAVDAGAASQGMLHSGATIKAEQTLGSNLANAAFGNYMSRLAGLSTQGLQALQLNNGSTSTFDTLLSGQSTGQQNTLTSAGTQNASIYGNAAGGLTNTATGFVNSPTGKNALSDLFGGGSYNNQAGLGGTGNTLGILGG